jgi:biopolymer transport protein ExbD
MKMKGAKQVHYDAGPNMTPLVDVVMVILIFLMLAGNFGDVEHYLASSVPIREKGVPVKDQVIPDDVELKIRVDSSGDRFIARLEGDERTFVDPKDLRDLLSGKLQGYLDKAINPDKIQVLISPGGFVKYNYIIQIYDAVLEASGTSAGKEIHFTKVAFEQAH